MSVSNFVVHLDSALRESEGQSAGESDGRLHEMGADRRAEVRAGARVRAAAGGGRQARAGRVVENKDVLSQRSRDLGFLVCTGAFAFVLIAIVFGIGLVLTKQSLVSIEKFVL